MTTNPKNIIDIETHLGKFVRVVARANGSYIMGIRSQSGANHEIGAVLTTTEASELAEALTKVAIQDLMIGDVLYQGGCQAEGYKSIVVEITAEGYVITKDNDDGTLSVWTTEEALESRRQFGKSVAS
jgi:hypothetical protein